MVDSLTVLINSLKDWLYEYDPLELYKWIVILSIHPSNQKYQTRFEFLFAILISCESEEFKRKEIDYGNLTDFISKFKEDTDSIFFIIEDFHPYSQLKLIPYFYNREKYFFFHGQTERTYELLRILEKIYIFNINEDHPELSLIRELFIQMLKYQTTMLTKLVNIDESNVKQKSGIYMPSLNFFNEMEDIVKVEEEKILDSRFTLELGTIEEDLVTGFNKILYGGFFNKFYVKLSEIEYSLFLPHLHIEILFKIFEEIVKKSENYEILEKLIEENLQNVLKDLFRRFFGIGELIKLVFNSKGEKISDEKDLIVLYENNLIIFNIVNLFSDKNISIGLENCYKRLNKTSQIIKNEPHLFLKFHKSYGYKVPVNDIRILKIILYESIDLSPKSIEFGFQTGIDMCVFSIMDLISIFELTLSPISFLNFIKEKYNSEKILTFDQINIFAAFHINNESLPAFGVNIITFDPHTWSDYYNNYLFNKYQDSIYELIEREFPNKFNKVKKWMDNQDLYECIDTRTLDSANIIKLENKLIWIINPVIRPNLTLEDMEFTMRVIGPLYADYLQRIIVSFEKLLKSYTTTNKYAILLVPKKICEDHPIFGRFKDYFSNVNEENPFIIKSFLNKQSKLISNVFYDYELWGEKFVDSTKNDNCKYAIKKLIYSIIEYFEPFSFKDEIKVKVEKYIEMNFIETDRDYFLDSIPARNLEIKSYQPYIKWNPTDQERVLKDVESYLRDNQVEQKHLSSEDSKELLNRIYKVFYKKLESVLSQYDINLLYNAYKQLELVEGKRHLLRLEAGMRSPSQLDDDYKDYFTKTYDEISKLSSTQRFIIENILKFGIKGDKKFNLIDYGYIQSLSYYLIEISQASEFSYTKLLEYTIDIKDYYKYDEVISTAIFDYKTFKEVEFSSKLEGTRDFYKNLKSESKIRIEDSKVSKKERLLIDNLENAFQSHFSFTFTNMMRVLSILSSLEYPRKDTSLFPLFLIKYENLTKLIQEEYMRQYENRPTFRGVIYGELKEEEIRLIIDHLSLNFHSYDEEDILIHLKLMKKKNRVTLCPLVRINENILFGKECCNVAFQLWKMNIFAGVFPYNISEVNEISKAINEIHSYEDKIFEEDCGEIVKEVLGKENYIFRLKNFQRISSTLPKYPECGEIDLIAVNQNTKTFFILDAKNYSLKLSPLDIQNQINRFIKSKKSDLKKLIKKEAFIETHLNVFLDFFHLSNNQDWKFKKGFIIKYNFPSAYVPNLKVDFIFQTDLEAYLKSI